MSDNVEWFRRHFIRPLLEHKPEHMEEDEYLSKIMGVDRREIVTYKVKKDFALPGTYLEGGVHPIPGYAGPRRKLVKGELIVVRKDFHREWFEVENGGEVFQLTPRQWNSIQGVVLKILKGETPLDRPKQIRRRRL